MPKRKQIRAAARLSYTTEKCQDENLYGEIVMPASATMTIILPCNRHWALKMSIRLNNARSDTNIRVVCRVLSAALCHRQSTIGAGILRWRTHIGKLVIQPSALTFRLRGDVSESQ